MDNLTTIRNAWPAILEKIKLESGILNVSFTTWIEPLEVLDADMEGLTLYVPMGAPAINTLNKKYTLIIKQALAAVTHLNLRIHYTDTEEIKVTAPDTIDDATYSELCERAHLKPKLTFDTYVVGSNNKFAHAAALAVAESPGETYNPLYLYSGVGLGKTHLMNSIGHFILQHNPEARVLYVSSEVFTNDLIDSIRNGSSAAMSHFRDKYRNIDVLLIDDIQFIIGKESTQVEFFHTFEALYGQNKQIIISSDKPPKELGQLEERISSRLEMGLTADISSPDYETRMAVLRKKCELENYVIDDAVLDYISQNIHSNIRELEGCLNRVHAKSKLENREVTLELAEEILKDLITPSEQKTVTSEAIISAVSEHFGISVPDLKSSKRDKKIVTPRMIAMYLCRDMTDDALVTIAAHLNKKDHTTVLNSIKRIESEMDTNPQIKNAVEAIRKKVSP